MARFLWMLITGTLAGCGLAIEARLQEAQKLYEAQVAQCERLYPDRHRKPTQPRVSCFNNANMKLAEHDPDIDLTRAMTTQMLVLAERFDAGRSTPAQFEAEKAAVFADYRTRVMQRQNSTAMANAAADQAAAARQQAIAATMPKTTTCNRFGNTVTCY